MPLNSELPNDPTIKAIGERLGLSPDQTRSVVTDLLDDFTVRLEQRSLSRGGLANLVALLGYASAPEAENDPDEMRRVGSHIVDEVYGDATRARFTAARAARKAGTDAETVEAMLGPMSAVAAHRLNQQTNGAFNQLFDQLPPQSAPIGGMGGNMPRQEPLGVPGGYPDFTGRSGTRYDDLSDVVRRGGRVPGTSTGGLGRSIRDIIGNGMGYNSNGIVGWLIRLIVARYGWRIVSWIFGRMFRAR